MAPDSTKTLSFLPLTAFAYQVLLALADQDRHGYGILKEVERRSGGALKLRTGTLYTLLQRLLQEDLVAEAQSGLKAATDPRSTDRPNSRRRTYRLSALGEAVLRAEGQRLETLAVEARRTHVLGDARRCRP